MSALSGIQACRKYHFFSSHLKSKADNLLLNSHGDLEENHTHVFFQEQLKSNRKDIMEYAIPNSCPLKYLRNTKEFTRLRKCSFGPAKKVG